MHHSESLVSGQLCVIIFFQRRSTDERGPVMTLCPSASLWGNGPLVNDLLNQSAQAGFHYIDVEHDTLDEAGLLQARNLGLKISCVALHHRLPPGCSLDGSHASDLGGVITHLKRGLERS